MLNLRATSLTTLTAASLAAAHGHVANVIAGGLIFRNYDPTSDIYNANAPITAGWFAGDSDNGFVAPAAFQTPDIICHRNATPAKAHIQVAAGSVVSLQWSTWPDSHHGPVLDYLAPCNGLCENVDKTTLEFFKIDGGGLVSQGNPGLYASDTLIANNDTWDVRIPADLKAGNYVLRHEIIALHAAGSENGAQAYPQCVNLQVTGGGSDVPAGEPATSFYHEDDPGILVDIYTSSVNYIIPGPSLAPDGISSISQTFPAITGVGTATQPGATGGSSPPPPPATSTTTAVQTSVGGGTTTPKTTPSSTKMASTTTTVAKPTTTSAPSNNGGGGSQTLYGQCGGSGWAGPTACVAGAACASLNPWYSQCTAQ